MERAAAQSDVRSRADGSWAVASLGLPRRELLCGVAGGAALAALTTPALGAEGLFPSAEERDFARRGFAIALGESADASDLPTGRRAGEHLALALSGTPRSSIADDARLYGSTQPQWIELSPLEREGVDDGPLAERIRVASSVCLVDGPLLDWLVTLYPARRRSAVLHALIENVVSGGRVIGRGATAALMFGGGVARGATRDSVGESRLRDANPREQAQPRWVTGLGLGEDLCLDTHARSSGRLLRLVSTLIEAHASRGAFLMPRAAIGVDLERREWRSLGADPLIWIELDRARRESRFVESARLSVLAAGEGWSRRDRRWTLAPRGGDFAPAEQRRVAEPSDVAHVLESPRERLELSGEDSVVVLREMSDTTLHSTAADRPRPHRLGFDLRLLRGRFGELARVD